MEVNEQYWQAVQSRVCAHCVDSDPHGHCRLSAEEECGLRAHFPRIVEAILSVHDPRIEPYIDSLRRNVCAPCRHQTPDGRCSTRSRLDCGLDRYFPLVIDAVEEAHVGFEKHGPAFGDRE